MASVASQLTEEGTAHAQSDSLEDAREICADGSYFPNNLHISTVLFLTAITYIKSLRNTTAIPHLKLANVSRDVLPERAEKQTDLTKLGDY